MSKKNVRGGRRGNRGRLCMTQKERTAAQGQGNQRRELLLRTGRTE